MKKIYFITLLAILTVCFVNAFGQKEEKGMDTITGVPGVYGTEPHTYVCIETEAGQVYYVHLDNQKEVRELDRYNYIFTVEFIKGSSGSSDAAFYTDDTVRVISWKKID